MAIYHLSVTKGSRQSGQSAGAKCDYITRQGDYARSIHPDAIHVEHGNLPPWANGDPRTFWSAIDIHERANGVLFREIEFSLPRELDTTEQIFLSEQFARDVADSHNLPWTLAIHNNAGNPHAHLIVNERMNDDIERDVEHWFKRYNSEHPERGGAQKTTALRTKEWLNTTRAHWADLANSYLEHHGHDARIDHRSNADRGLEQEPGFHLGPAAHGYEQLTGEKSRRREDHESEINARLEAAAEAARLANEARECEQSIIQLLTDLSAARQERARLEQERQEQERQEQERERRARTPPDFIETRISDDFDAMHAAFVYRFPHLTFDNQEHGHHIARQQARREWDERGTLKRAAHAIRGVDDVAWLRRRAAEIAVELHERADYKRFMNATGRADNADTRAEYDASCNAIRDAYRIDLEGGWMVIGKGHVDINKARDEQLTARTPDSVKFARERERQEQERQQREDERIKEIERQRERERAREQARQEQERERERQERAARAAERAKNGPQRSKSHDHEPEL